MSRADMPDVAAFIDELRSEFGRQGIDDSIRAGMRGEAGRFYAVERGVSVGTPPDPEERWLKLSEMVIGPPPEVGRRKP